MNIPNWITLARIALIPVFVVFFYLPYQWAFWTVAFIFAVAALSDWLDGYLARTLQQTSRLGAFLDPVADKLVVAIALVFLVSEVHFVYLAVPAAIIVGREIVVSALREWMAEAGKRASIAVSFIGKIKTTLQLVSILVLLLSRPGFKWYLPGLQQIGYLLLWTAAVLTLWSMIMYLKASWPVLMLEEE